MPRTKEQNHAVYLQRKKAHLTLTTRWAKEHPERIKELKQIGYLKRLRQVLLASAKKRAKAKVLAFDLTLDDIVVPEFCPVLGVRLATEFGSDRKGARLFAPSLDRIVPAVGYVKGNVEVMSWRANRIKYDATPDELMAVATYAKRRLPCQE